MPALLNFLAKNWKSLATLIGAIIVVVSLTGIIVSNYQKRVYDEMLKKHDEATARRLTETFVTKVEETTKQHNKEKDEFVKRIKALCDQAGIGYDVILTPAYI